jgi:hypothetical protein
LGKSKAALERINAHGLALVRIYVYVDGKPMSGTIANADRK